ncbi:MAG: ABC transporter ATP-binding protein [Thermoanaerobaculales bacterium]|jgi:putative ABC transport system ATP-binding protein|nr:ABC transporter ATP-binding protein [Thermoanaerobaculales bacterium]
MIKTRGLTKVFRTEDVETTPLREIDLEIEKGDFVSVMGPSGCGKSTLLHLLGLLDSPTVGEYQLLGEEVSDCSERQRSALRKRNIGFVFQSFNLIDELTVFDNVELPLVYQRVAANQRRKQVEELLEQLGLGPRRNHYPQQLSGGQQQRVAVARAMVSGPQLILADEPTGNLDSVHGQEVMDSLVELNDSGTTIVMVTHSPAFAAFGRRTVNLFDGQIVTDQTGVGGLV